MKRFILYAALAAGIRYINKNSKKSHCWLDELLLMQADFNCRHCPTATISLIIK